MAASYWLQLPVAASGHYWPLRQENDIRAKTDAWGTFRTARHRGCFATSAKGTLMPEPDFKEQLESTANLALSAELKADLDVIMFLNDPRHSAPSLSSALADLVPNAEEAAGAILERRGKLGAFTQYSDLNDIAGLDPKALNALMQSGLQPEWLEKSASSTSVKVSLGFLSTLYAGALWWGPLLPSFKWGNNPWRGAPLWEIWASAMI